MQPPRREALEELEHDITRALRSGEESRLEVLGYGEISTVVALHDGDQHYACKRMPPFGDAPQFETYASLFDEYVATLRERGVQVVDSMMVGVPRDTGQVAAFCVQPLLSPSQLLPRYLAKADHEEACGLFTRLLDAISSAVDERVGLDGQLSNWALVNGELSYLDLTTPMLRDSEGNERMDTELLLSTLPWALRSFVRRFLVDDIVDKYYQVPGVVLDLLGNMHKERLTHLLPDFVGLANERAWPNISEEQAARYYRSDALLWEALLRMRRLDRAWQRHVRRRNYGVLLPGPIER